MDEQVESAEREVDGYRVRVEMRPPRVNEFGWYALPDLDAEEVLEDVVRGRSCADSAIASAGFGWVSWRDAPEIDDDGDRVVTVVVERQTPVVG